MVTDACFFLGLRQYQPINIDRLAQAIYHRTTERDGNDGLQIFESDSLQQG
ncbi:hypothetical protein [Oceanicoccus sagamiensis]|uniref:hypothetical protein n=1 Tax=Oceanicoccus sagamiensis TaxID=716816 RepID=UPI0012F48310|nr:hypothetical protein [Oceanicoccus sagamiensis]